nr:MAG TPA: hypothetical protein [Caudoviricetes sp.]
MDAIDLLKEKTIEDYKAYVKKLNKGYRMDYSLILNEISFIETYSKLDNCDFIYQHLINTQYDWNKAIK